MTIDVIDNPQKVQIMRLKKPPMQALRIEWGLIAASSLLFLGGSFLVLSVGWQPDLAFRWLVLPSLVIAYLLHVLWRNLELNLREGELDLLPDLGWGNRLTLLRGLLVAGMMGFLLLPRPEGWLAWIPARLTSLGYAAAGHFDAALGAWRAPSEQQDASLPEYNENLLARVGVAALALTENDDESLIERGVRGATAANRLVFRSLLIWAVIISAMTLYGFTQ